MKAMRLITVLLLTGVLLLGLCLPAFGAARFGDASGGQPLSDDRIWMADNMYYDTTTHDYVYPVSDTGLEVHANVADGMILRGRVNVTGAKLFAYKDGEYFDGSLSGLETPGEYVVMTQVGSENIRLFSFTLTGPTSSKIYNYAVPAGMYVTSARRDEEEIAFERYSVPMQADGLYQIEYECIETGIVYTLEVTVDRTPPELQFSGSIDERHRVHSALHISGIETGGALRVSMDGAPVEVRVSPEGEAELLNSGSYYIEAYDAAGNRSEYSYTILLYLNASSVVFFILLFASIAAVGVYIFIKRKNLKVG